MLRPLHASPEVPSRTAENRSASAAPAVPRTGIGPGARGRDLGCVVLCGGLGTRVTLAKGQLGDQGRL
jgi:hypothetical protein